MHQLWQHKNGIYYVLYGERQRSRTSLRTKDRTEAQVRLGQFVATQGSVAPETPTVGLILKDYRDKHGPEVRSPDAIKFAVAALLREFADFQLSHLTPDAIKRYAKTRGAKPGTILREIGTLRAALSWAVEHRWIPASAKPIISAPVKAPRPRDRFVAEFIGNSNFIDAMVLAADNRQGFWRVRAPLGELVAASETPLQPGAAVTLSIRPENVELSEQAAADSANAFTATVDSKVFQGDFIDFQVRSCGVTLLARTHPSLRTPVGDSLHVRIDPEKCVVLASR